MSGASRVAVGLRGFVEQHDRRVAGRDAGKFFIGDQKARAGIADDVADFVGGEPIIDRQKHRADVAGRKHEFEKRRAVLHQHRDDVAGADPARGQPAADLADAGVEGGIGDVFAAVFQRTAIRRPPGMKGDEAGEIDHYSAPKEPVSGSVSP